MTRYFEITIFFLFSYISRIDLKKKHLMKNYKLVLNIKRFECFFKFSIVSSLSLFNMFCKKVLYELFISK